MTFFTEYRVLRRSRQARRQRCVLNNILLVLQHNSKSINKLIVVMLVIMSSSILLIFLRSWATEFEDRALMHMQSVYLGNVRTKPSFRESANYGDEKFQRHLLFLHSLFLNSPVIPKSYRVTTYISYKEQPDELHGIPPQLCAVSARLCTCLAIDKPAEGRNSRIVNLNDT